MAKNNLGQFGPAPGLLAFNVQQKPLDLLSAEDQATIEQRRSEGQRIGKKLRRKLRKAKKSFKQGRDLRTPQGAISQQFLANQQNIAQQDLLNRFGQQTAFGGRQFVTDPATGRTIAVDTLPEETQRLLSGLQSLGAQQVGALGQSLSQPLNFGNAPALPGINDFAGERQRIENELFGRFNEQFDPIFQKQREDLEASLAGRGIPVGSELFNKQIQELENNQNQARANARSEASGFAASEQQRLFNSALQGRQQSIGESLQLRQQPFTDLGNLLASQANIRLPQLQGIGQIGVPGLDVAGTSLGFANLFGQQNLAQNELALNRELGFAGLANSLQRARIAGEEARKTAAFQNSLNPPSSGGSGTLSPSDQLFGGIAAGAGSGIGSIIGSLI